MNAENTTYVPPKKSLWQRWYRPLMYVAVFLCVLFGVIFKTPFTLNVSQATLGVYDTIESIPETRQTAINEVTEKLQSERNKPSPDQETIQELEAQLNRLKKHPNGVLLLCFDFDPGTSMELQPMAEAILHHAFRKNITVLGNVGYNINSAQLAQDIINDVARQDTEEYTPKIDGEDYVFLGFRPNALMVYMQMGEDIIQAYETDYAGNDLNTLTVMDGVLNFNEIETVMLLTGYVSMPEMWMNVAKTKFNRDVGLGMTAVSAADYYPYVQSKQIVGLLAGLRGAAEYESAINQPAAGINRMRPQLYAHTLALFLLVLGNGESLYKFLTKKK